MNPLIQLKKVTPIFLVALACFGLSPAAQAQLPAPTPDGFYPGGNTAEGKNALIHVDTATGQFNTATGFEALFSNTTGFWNTANGRGALHENIGGSRNTATGVNALRQNQTGSQNTATGVGALRSNLNGINNTADGFQALNTNSSGKGNTGVGSGALNKNTIANFNTAIGLDALNHNTQGAQNTATGVEALFSNVWRPNEFSLPQRAPRTPLPVIKRSIVTNSALITRRSVLRRSFTIVNQTSCRTKGTRTRPLELVRSLWMRPAAGTPPLVRAHFVPAETGLRTQPSVLERSGACKKTRGVSQLKHCVGFPRR
jgi:hypothetical protein